MIEPFATQLEKAISARALFFGGEIPGHGSTANGSTTTQNQADHRNAFRLYNGHFEGNPTLVIDIYGTTALLQNCADPPGDGDQIVAVASELIQTHLPWIEAIVLKERNGVTSDAKRGRLLMGENPVTKICEHGIWYSVDLLLNHDASFYLDTRNVRQWAIDTLAGKSVLNTFAYTGSLGAAAMAGQAKSVTQTDLNKRFLNIGKTTYTLNGFPIDKKRFQSADFFPQVNRLKRAGDRFDCIFLDPPFFSATDHGTVDLAHDSVRLINKLRPLVKDGGQIVAVNNALYLSGAEYIQSLEALGSGGFVEVQEIIPVPEDITGYPETIQSPPITDPAPFNHSTKVAVLRIRHSQ